jgi:hypothetical protein
MEATSGQFQGSWRAHTDAGKFAHMCVFIEQLQHSLAHVFNHCLRPSVQARRERNGIQNALLRLVCRNPEVGTAKIDADCQYPRTLRGHFRVTVPAWMRSKLAEGARSIIAQSPHRGRLNGGCILTTPTSVNGNDTTCMTIVQTEFAPPIFSAQCSLLTKANSIMNRPWEGAAR